MRTAVLSFFVFFMTICLAGSGNSALAAEPTTAPAATVTSAPLRGLLVHGSDSQIWIARIVPDADGKGLKTLVHMRGDRFAQTWRPLAELTGRVVAMTHRGSQLVVRFDNGQLMFLWPRGSALGSSLPGKAKIVAMAGDDETFCALAPIPGGIAGLPKPTTSTSKPAILPGISAIQTAEHLVSKLVIFELRRNEWTPLADWPADAYVPPDAPVAMGIIGNHPVAAFRMTNGNVRLLRLSREKKWEDVIVLQPNFVPTELKVLENNHNASLWAAAPQLPGVVFFDHSGWSQPIDLKNPLATNLSDRDVTISSDLLRLVYVADNKVFEQRYDSNGTPKDKPTELDLRDPNADTRINVWIEMVIIGALVFAVCASFVRRRANVEAALVAQTIPLAPLSTRFFAGMVDLIPLIATQIYSGSQLDLNSSPWERATDPDAVWLALIGWAAYILHTCVAEMLSGRSIGKMIFGLRVVTIDGKKPGIFSLLVRNVLRVIDIGVAYLPLLLVFYSPLSQRVGDVAAGTIVITEKPQELSRSDSNPE